MSPVLHRIFSMSIMMTRDNIPLCRRWCYWTDGWAIYRVASKPNVN